MAYFPAAGIGGVMKSEILIDYDPTEMAGITVTLAHAASAEGHTPESYTVTLDNTGEVEQDVKNLGLWTISWTHQGQSYSEEFDVHYYGYFHVVLHEGFTWRLWATAGGIPINQYNSLSQLLADEAAVRRLFIVHDAVDYMCDNANSTQNQDLITIINNGLCAKWANLSDYALDNMEADAVLSDLMNTADLYGYGELIEDNGDYVPKGNVPVMTSDTAPYGEAIRSSISGSGFEAYRAFDGDATSTWRATIGATNNYIGYKFISPTKTKKIKIRFSLQQLSSYTTPSRTFKVRGSNDGTTWNDIKEFTIEAGTGGGVQERDYEVDVSAQDYYLQYSVFCADTMGVRDQWSIMVVSLQFYGRELKGLVPNMIGNSTPSGECFGDSEYSGQPYYHAFDKNTSTQWSSNTANFNGTEYIGYSFPSDRKVYMCEFTPRAVTSSSNVYSINGKFQMSDDKLTWEDITDLKTLNMTAISPTKLVYPCDSVAINKHFRFLYVSKNVTTIWDPTCAEIQFYGKDYSEKEFANDGSKWLYDHGVELEEMDDDITRSGYTIDSVVKNQDSAYVSSLSSGSHGCGFKNKNLLDLSSYNLARAKGSIRGTKIDNYFGTLLTCQSKEVSQNDSAFNIVDMLNAGGDISNINGNHYAIIYVANGRAITITELWLE